MREARKMTNAAEERSVSDNVKVTAEEFIARVEEYVPLIDMHRQVALELVLREHLSVDGVMEIAKRIEDAIGEVLYGEVVLAMWVVLASVAYKFLCQWEELLDSSG
jgi:hypothetical protein